MLASLRMRTKRLVMNIIIKAALRARAAKLENWWLRPWASSAVPRIIKIYYGSGFEDLFASTCKFADTEILIIII